MGIGEFGDTDIAAIPYRQYSLLRARGTKLLLPKGCDSPTDGKVRMIKEEYCYGIAAIAVFSSSDMFEAFLFSPLEKKGIK